MKKVITEGKVYNEIKLDGVIDSINSAIHNYKDLQEIRIACGNRLVSSFYLREDISDDIKREVKDLGILKLFKDDYDFLNTYVNGIDISIKKAIKEKLDNLKVIRDVITYSLYDNYETLLDVEKSYYKIINTEVKKHPMWDLFFNNVKGCGPIVAGTLLSCLDIHKARHVSCFWSYAGLGTILNSEGERVAQSKKVTKDVQYKTLDGEIKMKKSLGYNPDIQSLLLNIFTSSVLKAGLKSGENKYAECYYEYKHRYKNRADLEGASELRIHRMALRQCAKAFLRDLWVIWRTYEGYEVTQPYEVEYLHRAPHKFNEYHNRIATV